jgi:hypothetical protein
VPGCRWFAISPSQKPSALPLPPRDTKYSTVIGMRDAGCQSHFVGRIIICPCRTRRAKEK